MNIELSEIVMQLHDIARKLEQGRGIDDLTKELRHCADRVHEVGVTLDREKYNKEAQ